MTAVEVGLPIEKQQLFNRVTISIEKVKKRRTFRLSSRHIGDSASCNVDKLITLDRKVVNFDGGKRSSFDRDVRQFTPLTTGIKNMDGDVLCLWPVRRTNVDQIFELCGSNIEELPRFLTHSVEHKKTTVFIDSPVNNVVGNWSITIDIRERNKITCQSGLVFQDRCIGRRDHRRRRSGQRKSGFFAKTTAIEDNDCNFL